MLELDPTLRRLVRTRPARSSIALSVGVAIGLAVTGIALVHAGFTAPEPNCPPLPPAAAAAPRPPTPVVAPAHVPCEITDDDTPLAEWSWGHDHLGPFAACATIDRAFVERVLPGYDVTEDAHDFIVSKQSQPVLRITAKPLRVEILTSELETPWRIHAGDVFKTLRAHHRGMVCVADSDPGEKVWCSQLGDGWRENMKYHLDLRAAGADLDFDAMGASKIRAISWQPSH
jgi:hypothetical protein